MTVLMSGPQQRSKQVADVCESMCIYLTKYLHRKCKTSALAVSCHEKVSLIRSAIAWDKKHCPTSKICGVSHALVLLYQSNNKIS